MLSSAGKDASTRVSDEGQRVEKVEIFPNNKNALSIFILSCLRQALATSMLTP